MVHLYNGILRSRKKELLHFTTVWMILESIMLSEICQVGGERQMSYDLTYKRNIALAGVVQWIECWPAEQSWFES